MHSLIGHTQSIDGLFEFFALAFEIVYLQNKLLWAKGRFKVRELERFIARLDQVMDFRERKSKLSASEYHFKPLTIMRGVEARHPLTFRMKQTATFVEAKRTQSDLVLLRDMPDFEELASRLRWFFVFDDDGFRLIIV